MALEFSVWGHAGIRLERDGARLAIDPGSFTDPRLLERTAAVLITHEHADHVEPERLAAAMADSPDLQVWAPGSVAEALATAGAPVARVHVTGPGNDFEAAGFRVRALGGQHAVIHPSLPQVSNLAFLIDEVVLHPGDSFPRLPDDARVELLALPVSAPWMKLAEAADYAAEVSPTTVVPIHDAILSAEGRQIADKILPGLIGGAEYRRLGLGEVLQVGD